MLYPRKIVINGNKPLSGSISVSGSKNAALPVIIASLLVDGPVSLFNVPCLKDIQILIDVFKKIGVSIDWDLKSELLKIDSSSLNQWDLSAFIELSELRYSILLLGPLVARFGNAEIPFPGGCDFCERPLDMHFKALEALGCRIVLKKNSIYVELSELQDVHYEIAQYTDDIAFIESFLTIAPVVCQNVMLLNTPIEPEVECLIDFINKAGGFVKGYSFKQISVKPKKLCSVEFNIISDRIEAVSHLALAVASRSKLTVKNCPIEHMYSSLNAFRKMGLDFHVLNKDIVVDGFGKLKNTEIRTAQYPGFPTDAQPLMVPVLCSIIGDSVVRETIYENRFENVDFFNAIGSEISIEGESCNIFGKAKKYLLIKGRCFFSESIDVRAKTLRAGFSFIIGGLVTDGSISIYNPEIIMRGYSNIVKKYKAIGADIEAVYD